jgi:hypothetical protein
VESLRGIIPSVGYLAYIQSAVTKLESNYSIRAESGGRRGALQTNAHPTVGASFQAEQERSKLV